MKSALARPFTNIEAAIANLETFGRQQPAEVRAPGVSSA
jgi:hypothetical protein